METREKRKIRHQKETIKEARNAMFFVWAICAIFIIILWIGLTLMAR